MPLSAHIYLYATISAGAAVLALSLTLLDLADAARLAAFLAASALASAMRIRLPGVGGTVTPGFVVVLLSTAFLPLAGTALVCVLSGLVQTLCGRGRRPVQVAFNAANLAVCGAVAHWLSHAVAPDPSASAVVARLAVSLVALFLCNVTSVSLVVCLVEGRPLASIWRLANYLAFPYYLTGTAVAAVMVQSSSLGMGALLLELPLLFLMHLHYSDSMASTFNSARDSPP